MAQEVPQLGGGDFGYGVVSQAFDETPELEPVVCDGRFGLAFQLSTEDEAANQPG